jgi:hypothetical protein
MARHGALPIVSATVALALAPAAARALTVPELICQQSIGKESLRLVKTLDKASRRCHDAEVEGKPCDAARLDAEVAAALQKLERRLGARCGAIVLEHLGFPGLCGDPGGPPFTAADLAACVGVSHRARVAAALATAYPDRPGPLDPAEARCQRAIGGGGGHLVAKRLRARQSCLNDQLSGRIGPAVDCRAEPAPAGPGSGNTRTDRRLTTAESRLARLLARGCAGVALEALGFPGACADPGDPPFTLEDLHACVVERQAAAADAMLAIEYPPSG